MSEYDDSPIVGRAIEIVSPNNVPRRRLYRRAAIVVSGAYLTTAGTIKVAIGDGVTIPVWLPNAAGVNEVISIYDGVMPVPISEFTLSGPELAGGAVNLLLVEF